MDMNIEAQEKRLVRILKNNKKLTRGKLNVWLTKLTKEQIDELLEYCLNKGSIKQLKPSSIRNGEEIIKYALPDYEPEIEPEDGNVNDPLVNAVFIEPNNSFGKVLALLKNGYYLIGNSDNLEKLKSNEYDSKKVVSLSDMTGLTLYDAYKLVQHN
jgi:hypothetical protein